MHPASAVPWEDMPLVDLLAGHGGMVALYDPADRVRWSNAGFRRAFGIPQGSTPTWAELMRASHADGLGVKIVADDFEHWLASAASRRGKLAYRQFEADLHDGRWILMTQTTDARGWMLEIGVDVSDMGCEHRDLRAARDRALRASQEDGLTGVPSRASALARLRADLAQPGPPPCVALVDLDHFKQINDRFGHAAGDTVLRDFARRLRDGLRRADACGRIGGEEFLLSVQGLDARQAQGVVERLLAHTRAARPLAGQPDFGYAFSAGLVQAQPGEAVEAVMARADAALYEAKRSGRGRCVLHLAGGPPAG